MGVGIADGVGGWQAYGIDSSSFSESLMSACKIICDKKEENLLKANSLSTEMLQNESYSEFLQNNDSMHTNEPSEISTSFGITVRNHKLRKIKSSFHLDDDFIQKWKESSGPNTEEFKSPQSDSTMKDKKKKINLNLEPRCIIKEAYRKVSASGSSTAWVAVVQNKILKIANLGDSRWMLIRFSSFDNKSQILLKTDEQQHSFNAPYQLANIPEDLKHPKSKSDDKRVRFWNDNAEDSILYQWKVSEGDIVLLATDGLFDNLFIDEILQIIDNFMTELLESKSLWSMDSIKTSSNTPETYLADKNILNQKNAKKLAKNLVNEAFKKSRSHAWNTPFGEKFNSSNLKRNNEILTWNGGKPDDIWAVIGFIQN